MRRTGRPARAQGSGGPSSASSAPRRSAANASTSGPNGVPRIHHRTQRAVGSQSQSAAPTARARVAYEMFAPFSQPRGYPNNAIMALRRTRASTRGKGPISSYFPVPPVGLEPTTFGLNDDRMQEVCLSYGHLGSPEFDWGQNCVVRDTLGDTNPDLRGDAPTHCWRRPPPPVVRRAEQTMSGFELVSA